MIYATLMASRLCRGNASPYPWIYSAVSAIQKRASSGYAVSRLHPPRSANTTQRFDGLGHFGKTGEASPERWLP